jgi:hypothetical protein
MDFRKARPDVLRTRAGLTFLGGKLYPIQEKLSSGVTAQSSERGAALNLFKKPV